MRLYNATLLIEAYVGLGSGLGNEKNRVTARIRLRDLVLGLVGMGTSLCILLGLIDKIEPTMVDVLVTVVL